jgi:hypothetical protein
MTPATAEVRPDQRMQLTSAAEMNSDGCATPTAFQLKRFVFVGRQATVQ